MFTLVIERNIKDLSALHDIICKFDVIDENVKRTHVIAPE